MGDSISWLKKIGVGLVVLILILMMGLVFSNQPMDEITSILTGGSKIGKFKGEEISPQLYNMAKDGCKRNFAAYGNVPEFFVTNCVENQLMQLYVLPSIGEDLGLSVTRESVEEQILDAVRLAQISQQAYANQDDKLSAEELYRQELTYMPMDLRTRLGSAQKVQEILSSPIAYPKEVMQADDLSSTTTFDLQIVRFTNTELLSKLETEVPSIPLEDLQKAYDAEQKDLADKEKRSFAERKPFLESRLRTEKKQALLADIKKQLSTQPKEFNIDEIAKIAKSQVGRLNQVKLADAAQIPIPGQGIPANISNADFLLSLEKGKIGPIQAGDATIYLVVSNLRKGNVQPVKPEQHKEMQGSIGSYLLTYTIQEVAKAGEFQLRKAQQEQP